MPRLLEESEIDLDSEALDLTLDAFEQEMADAIVPREITNTPDLTDGGRVGGASIFPADQREEFKEGRAKGRPAARRAWTWNGTETVLTLAWDTDGKTHDGGRRYLAKKHCLCCGDSGFKTRQCTKCLRDSCPKCRGSTLKGQVIPFNYVSKEKVPFQEKFYGDINCFLSSCSRRDGTGFKTAQDMRIHGRSRHRMEYEAYQEVLQAEKTSEIDELRQQLNALTTAAITKSAEPTVNNGNNGKRERTPKQLAADERKRGKPFPTKGSV